MYACMYVRMYAYMHVCRMNLSFGKCHVSVLPGIVVLLLLLLLLLLRVFVWTCSRQMEVWI